MSDFKAKMHQYPKFGCGSAPDPAGELTALLQTSQLDLRGLLLREGDGVEGMGGDETGGEGSVVESKEILKIDHARWCTANNNNNNNNS